VFGGRYAVISNQRSVIRKQEARSKKQEARSKKQEAREAGKSCGSRLRFFLNKKIGVKRGIGGVCSITWPSDAVAMVCNGSFFATNVYYGLVFCCAKREVGGIAIGERLSFRAGDIHRGRGG
jgi:hypothetical protein